MYNLEYVSGVTEMDIESRIKNIKNKANELKQSKAAKKAAAFIEKMGKKTIEKYNSLSKKGKMILWGSLVMALPVAKGGVFVKDKVAEHRKEVKRKEYVQSKINKLTKKHKITDKESYDELFNDAFPMIVVSLLPTECLVLEPYSDNGTVSNTIGLGSYITPVNPNDMSGKWDMTSVVYKDKQDAVISGDYAIDLMSAWYDKREAARIKKNCYKKLKGAEITPFQDCAIFGITYNNEKNGFDFCKFVRENYDDPMKCAQKIVKYTPKGNFPGIAKRHLHEAYLFLNLDNYALKCYTMQYYTGTNSRGKKYYVTSVYQLSDEDVKKGIEAINSGDTNRIIEEQNKICNYVKKGAVTISDLLAENLSQEYLLKMQEYNVLNQLNGTISYDDSKKLVSAGNRYEEALTHYEKAREFEKGGNKENAQKEFEAALKGFQKMQKEGVHGADLNNDIAITYYHLGEYKKCIEESKKVVKTGETEAFAAAYYNMGLAYRELNNPKEAKKCFDSYKNNGGSEKAYNSAVNSLQKKPAANVYRGR